MPPLSVEPQALALYAAQVDRARDSVLTTSSYVATWATKGTGGEFWRMAEDPNTKALATIQNTLYRLTCLLEASAPELRSAGRYYRSTDLTSAADLDRVLPEAMRMCPTPLEYENANIVCKPGLFKDPNTPESKLIPPPKEPDNPVNRMGIFDYISPTSWILKGLDEILGFDPVQEVQNKIVGDWEIYARMPSVLNSASSALHDIAVNIQSGAGSLQANWQGNAGEGAYRYFTDLATAVEGLRAPLAEMGEEYQILADAVWSAGDAIGGLLKGLCDMALIGGVGAIGGTITAASGVGAASGYGVAAVSSAAVLEQWALITKYLAMANAAIMVFRSRVGMSSNDLETFKLPVIGGGAGYDHPLTGTGAHA